jgi:hypothetical protein
MHYSERDSVLHSLENQLTRWVKEIRYFPYWGSNQVWDGVSLVNVKDTTYIEPENIVLKTSKKDGRIDLLLQKLKSYRPSKQYMVWQDYIKKLMPPTKKLWDKNFPLFPYPLPTTMEYFNQKPESIPIKRMKGFIYFSMMMSLLQLRTKGRAEPGDRNFYPSFCVADKSTFDFAAYFSKFIVFMLYYSKKDTTVIIDHIPALSLNDKLFKLIDSNSRMTNTLYKFISKGDYFEFWNASIQLEGTDRFFSTLFRVAAENLK